MPGLLYELWISNNMGKHYKLIHQVKFNCKDTGLKEKNKSAVLRAIRISCTRILVILYVATSVLRYGAMRFDAPVFSNRVGTASR